VGRLWFGIFYRQSNVAYAQFHFLDAFKRWDASNLFNGAWNISTEDGKNFFIPQWYAQPAKIDDQRFRTRDRDV
jgi:hypothetical protein